MKSQNKQADNQKIVNGESSDPLKTSPEKKPDPKVNSVEKQK